MNKLTIFTKNGQSTEMTSKNSLKELYEKNKAIFDDKDKKYLVTSDEESFTIIPKDNIALIDIRKVSD